MRRVRRISSDVHVELTPMIDVVFLLLTFFFFYDRDDGAGRCAGCELA